MHEIHLALISGIAREMGFLLDAPKNPDDETEIALRFRISQWHGILSSVLADEEMTEQHVNTLMRAFHREH